MFLPSAEASSRDPSLSVPSPRISARKMTWQGSPNPSPPPKQPINRTSVIQRIDSQWEALDYIYLAFPPSQRTLVFIAIDLVFTKEIIRNLLQDGDVQSDSFAFLCRFPSARCEPDRSNMSHHRRKSRVSLPFPSFDSTFTPRQEIELTTDVSLVQARL